MLDLRFHTVMVVSVIHSSAVRNRKILRYRYERFWYKFLNLSSGVVAFLPPKKKAGGVA